MVSGQDVDRVVSRTKLALDDGVGVAAAAFQRLFFRPVDVLPVVRHLAATGALELQVPSKLLVFRPQMGHVFQLSLELQSDLNHDAAI